MITVDTLINYLKALPPDARVVIPGYEAGVDDIAAPKLTCIRLNVGGGVYGCHDEVEASSPSSEQAVLIGIHDDHA
jgi:hypothetical protein